MLDASPAWDRTEVAAGRRIAGAGTDPRCGDLRSRASLLPASFFERYLLAHLWQVPLVERDYKDVAAMFWAIDKNGGVAVRPLSEVTMNRNHATPFAPLLDTAGQGRRFPDSWL